MHNLQLPTAVVILLLLSQRGILVRMSTVLNKRKKSVKNAIANERLEGLHVSTASRKIADSYVVGTASAQDAAKKIRARYGTLLDEA